MRSGNPKNDESFDADHAAAIAALNKQKSEYDSERAATSALVREEERL